MQNSSKGKHVGGCVNFVVVEWTLLWGKNFGLNCFCLYTLANILFRKTLMTSQLAKINFLFTVPGKEVRAQNQHEKYQDHM